MKLSLFFFVLVAVVFSSCKDAVYNDINGETQGTTYHIIYNKDVMLKSQIDSVLNEIDLSLSTYNENSLLYKLNNNEDLPLDKHFVKVFNKAMEISEVSDGMFDVTVGPLIEMYGFGSDKHTEVNDTIIDSLLQYVGFTKVKIVNNKLVKDVPEIRLDLNALAQGYTSDYVADYLERQGIVNYFVEVGGEVICKGLNNFGEGWRIGIEKPIENTDNTDKQIELIISIKNEKKAIATSGNYRKFYIENGVKFTHSIDPHTGYPARDSLVSVSIMADDCMTADGFATACMVSGFEKAKQIVTKNEALEAFLIYLDKEGKFQFWFSPGFEKYVVE